MPSRDPHGEFLPQVVVHFVRLRFCADQPTARGRVLHAHRLDDLVDLVAFVQRVTRGRQAEVIHQDDGVQVAIFGGSVRGQLDAQFGE